MRTIRIAELAILVGRDGRVGAVADSRRRLLAAQAERVGLENRLRAGELVVVADVRWLAAGLAGALAEEMDGLAAGTQTWRRINGVTQ